MDDPQPRIGERYVARGMSRGTPARESAAPTGAEMFMCHLDTTADAVVYEPIAATRLR